MRAAIVTTLTGPEGVEVREVSEPTADLGEVLVDVKYAGVTYPDVLQTRGNYQFKPALPFIAGWEVAGTVRADAGAFTAGDRVAALPMLGGFAHTVAVPLRLVFPLPDSVTFAVGAALPLNYLTAHFALVHRARLRPGETVLVHGAAGGVGTAACNIAAAYGARVIAVVSTEAKADIARRAGAHDVALAEGFKNEVHRLTEGRGVDIVVDPVGGTRFTDSLRSLHREGRVLVLGFTAGEIPTVKVNRLLLTNTTVMGVAVKEFWEQAPNHARHQWQELMPLIASGTLDPVLGPEFGLDDAASAIAVLDQRRAMGKILIRVRA